MFKTLLKKQMLEIFKNFFYDSRKGKNRSKKGAILYIVFYALLMFGYLGGLFGFLAHSLANPLVSSDMGWLYFIIMGGIALVLGIFGSVFSTYSSLYMAKDNDLLLSMPIPVRYILLSRLMGVFLTSLLYTVIVLIPMTIMYLLAAPISFKSIIGPIVFSIDILLLVFILSTALGWVVAKISTKMKNKSMMTTVIALLGVGLYYVVYFRIFRSIESFILNIQSAEIDVHGGMSIIYNFGLTGCGAFVPMIVTTIVVIAALVLVFIILSRTFIKIVTTKTGSSKIKYREKKVQARSVGKALLFKELTHLKSSSGYMLNCALGTLLMPIAAIALLVKGSFLYEVLNDVFGNMNGALGIMALGLISMMTSMNDISAPSVSLEGKALWISKTIPIASLQFIKAKMWNHVVLTLPPALFIALVISFVLRVGLLAGVLLVLCTAATCFVQAMYGLFINIKRPNLNWTSEIVVIKQGFGVFLTIMSGWFFAILEFLSGLFLTPIIGALPIYAIWLVLTSVLAVLLYIWLRNKGTKIVEEL